MTTLHTAREAARCPELLHSQPHSYRQDRSHHIDSISLPLRTPFPRLFFPILPSKFGRICAIIYQENSGAYDPHFTTSFSHFSTHLYKSQFDAMAPFVTTYGHCSWNPSLLWPLCISHYPPCRHTSSFTICPQPHIPLVLLLKKLLHALSHPHHSFIPIHAPAVSRGGKISCSALIDGLVVYFIISCTLYRIQLIVNSFATCSKHID